MQDGGHLNIIIARTADFQKISPSTHLYNMKTGKHVIGVLSAAAGVCGYRSPVILL